MAEPPFVTRVTIENYKSIARCDVRLGPLTFLVGRNGAGKSNFLDVLHFIADALNTSLDAAIRARGGVDDLRHRGATADAAIALRFELALPGGQIGSYALRLAQRPHGGLAVAEEECTVEFPLTGHPPTGFSIHDGVLDRGTNAERPVPADRLYLPVSAMHYDRPVFETLSRMAFYNPVPAHMHRPSEHDNDEVLLPDGSNCASVLLRLDAQRPHALERIGEYLRAIVPDLARVQAAPIEGYDVLRFYQTAGGSAQEQPYVARSMSDGTLHALAVLTALLQGGVGEDRALAVIGIEEPETALHPAATAVLRDAFSEAAARSQVILTTQSADLLDDADIAEDAILAAVVRAGVTSIGRLGEGQRSIIRDHLATAGELLRTSNFWPAPSERSA